MPSNQHIQATVHRFKQAFSFETPHMGSTETIANLEIAYETWGNPQHPAVLVCHALTGNTHCHDSVMPEDPRAGWWNAMVGPGRPIDTTRYHVICTSMLGGCGGSSGPATINPATGRPYGLTFPIVTIHDMVRSQAMLLDHLGVRVLHAAIGGSMGGFQVLQWAISYPERVKNAIVIASGAYSSQFQILTNRAQINAIQNDVNYAHGCYSKGKEPSNGLAIARQIGFTTFISPEMMERKFAKYHHSEREPFADRHFHLQRLHEAENYLHKVSNGFPQDFDANSMIYLLQTWNHFDLAIKYGSLQQAFAPVKARMLVVAATGDNLFPPFLSQDIMQALQTNGSNVEYTQIEEIYGHDFFLVSDITMEKLNEPILRFLQG